jgi:septum site-determining protein MinD
MKALCDELKQDVDYVLVDCPAGIEQGFRNAIAGADRALVVTTPEVAAVRDADRIIGLLLADTEISDPQLILNRYRPQMVRRGDMLSVEDVKEHLAIELLGIVPEDEAIIVSTNKGEPAVLNANSRAGEAYQNVSRRIRGEEVPFMDIEDTGNIMTRIRRMLGLRTG